MNIDALDPALVSQDYLWRGRLTFFQPTRKAGYRFNLDPVLLSGFCQPEDHVLDLGTGCGIIGILLLALKKAARVTGVELQTQLAQLACKNAEVNGFADRFSVISDDLRHAIIPQVDAVVFNPPYYPQDQYRQCGNAGRDFGRRECHGTLKDFLIVASQATTVSNGPIRAIIPARRHDELAAYARQVGLEIRQRCWVFAREGQKPVHAMVMLTRKSSEVANLENSVVETSHLILHPPLKMNQEQYTSEVQKWVDGPDQN